ncbi:MAG: glycoside hydrolase family 13 protein [Ignavibacteriales bacterium]|nr:glycoside hydrolase family 13 protein [Ignavibacteriales bacterium]
MRFFLVVAVIFFSHLPSISQPLVPDWARDAVWYQIFPERFRDGDPTNGPTSEELGYPPQWRLSPWTSDWYKLQPWEQERSDKFYDVVFDRRYGGDLQGVLEKLDYLADLGITALYFNPIFEAHSLHKYDASTYHHIDNNFGPDPAGDLAAMKTETEDPATWKWTAADKLFLKLIEESHKRGIKIIIDGVFNHCGTHFWAFQDIIKNQQGSRYADWFDVKRWDDPSTPENEFDYKGWWDYKGLPEFREDENGFVTPVREYFFNITRRWMDPNGDGDPSDGIDGWRLDVANDVSHVFWREWRTVVKGVNPDAYIVGEIWDDAANWLKGDEFDAVMNYRFSRAIVRFFIDTDGRKYSVMEFDRELEDVRSSYPAEVNYVLQNLIDSHDTDRWSSMIINPNRKYDHENGLRQNSEYRIQKPEKEAFKILRLMALFQMTYVGAPMIYYGTEAGMWGADDPDDRKPMVWDDLMYEDETTHPFPGKTRSPDKVQFNHDLFGYFKKLIHIRKRLPALTQGTFTRLIANDKEELYAFERGANGEKVIVVINNSPRIQDVRLGPRRKYHDLIDGKTIDAELISVESKSGTILTPQ